MEGVKERSRRKAAALKILQVERQLGPLTLVRCGHYVSVWRVSIEMRRRARLRPRLKDN